MALSRRPHIFVTFSKRSGLAHHFASASAPVEEMVEACTAKSTGALSVLVVLIAASGHRSAWADASKGTSSGAEVKIDNFTFEPQALDVKAGTTITWTYRDDTPHTVVSSDFLFKSKTLDTDDTFQFTLAKSGTYSYFCSLHPKMTGTIVVK